MISTDIVTIHANNVKREILISPLLLQSKEPPVTKFGKIINLYFYENWVDNEYIANLQKEADHHRSDKYLINYGQDFSKFYLGTSMVDFENRTLQEWQVDSEKLNNHGVKILEAALFDPDSERRRIIIFTPTRPDDFRHGNLKYLF